MDLKETKLSSEPIYEVLLLPSAVIGCACLTATKANGL